MAMQGRLEIKLELELDGEPIRGRISADGTPSRSFTGWLELTSRLVDLMHSGTVAESPDIALRREGGYSTNVQEPPEV